MGALELSTYIPAGLAFIFALGFCGLFTFLGMAIGPKRTNKIKASPFECGMDPIGSPRGRYSVKFYQIAILFLVFDIEAAFMYPWAAKYDELSVHCIKVDAMGACAQQQIILFGFIEMLLFVGVLAVALTYVWRKGAIGWD